MSKAWGGRVSDVEIVKESGFMDSKNHMPADQVLADRGFTLQVRQMGGDGYTDSWMELAFHTCVSSCFAITVILTLGGAGL